MLVQYQAVMKKEDVVLAINGEVRTVIDDLKDSIYFLEEFVALSFNSQVIEACESLKAFHEELKELETIIANIRKNYEGFVRASLPELKEETAETEAAVATDEDKPSEAANVNKLMEAINTLKQLKATV